MQADKIIDLISRGRTDYILDLLNEPGWKDLLLQG
jgi:hypothetical protein